MKVLITVGTGFVGGEIVRPLHGAGHWVRVLARSPKSPDVLHLGNSDRFEMIEGDVVEAAGLDKSLAGVDAVIHLVGIISEIGSQTFENVHVRGTQNLLGAVRVAGISR